MKRRGYSLIELLTVIFILGVLFTLGTVSWQSAITRSRDNARRTDLARIKTVLKQYYADFRAYPSFQKGWGLVFDASWQLTNLKPASSPQPCQAETRLVPKYADSLPIDPLQSKKFTDLSCNDPLLTLDQNKRYLYISGSSAASSGPSDPADHFGLLANLENIKDSSDEFLADSDNPFKNTQASFGSWYSSLNGYKTPINLDANYMITDVGN